MESQLPAECDPDVLRYLSAALHDVTPLFEVPNDPDDKVAWANDRARLVMVDHLPRSAYWEGIVVAKEKWDAHPIEWNLLWTLARHGQRLVTQGLLSNPEKHAIRSRRARLKKMLADSVELNRRIVAKQSAGG